MLFCLEYLTIVFVNVLCNHCTCQSNKMEIRSMFLLQILVINVGVFVGGNEMYVIKHQTVLLSCNRSPDTQAIYWSGPPNMSYTSGNQINPMLKHHEKLSIKNTSLQFNLEIRNFSHEEEGFYQCSRLSVTGHISDTVINVYIREPPSSMHVYQEEYGNTVYGFEGQPINVTCTVVSGKPKEQLYWLKNNAVVKTGGPASITYSFHTSAKDHLTNLTCRAENNVTIVPLERTVRLYLYTIPSVNVTPRTSINITEGTTGFTLFCNVSSNHDNTTLVWTRVRVGQPNKEYFNNTSSYRFEKIDRSDAGIYICEANSPAGKASDGVTIYVQFLDTPNILSIFSATSRLLRCVVNGVPNNYRFSHWEHKTEYDDHIRFIPDEGGGQITIKDVLNETDRHHDRGIYLCRVSNGVRESSTGQYNLSATGKPYFVARNNATQYGIIHQTAKIKVNVVSFPEITKVRVEETEKVVNVNDPVLEQLEDTMYSKSVFVKGYRLTIPIKVENVTDFKPYTVTVTNQIGSRSYTVNLTSASCPETPLNFKAAGKDDTILVSWTPGFDGGYPQSFFMQYRKHDEDNWKSLDVSFNDNYAISGLTYATKYHIRMCARNLIGDSNMTNEIIAETDAEGFYAAIYGFISFLFVALPILAVAISWRFRTGRHFWKQIISCLKCTAFRQAAVGNELYGIQHNVAPPVNADRSDVQVYSSIDRRAHLTIGQCVSYSVSKKPAPSPCLGHKQSGPEQLQNKSSDSIQVSKVAASSHHTNEMNYLDVCFDPSPERAQFKIHGTENKTPYADIDISRSVGRIPSTDGDDTDDDCTEAVRKMRRRTGVNEFFTF